MDLRKIDSLIAEKVMGFEVTRDGGIRQDGKRWGLPSYSQKIEYAWLVAETISSLGFFQLSRDAEGYWCAVVQSYRAHNQSAPLAICLAALKAVGVEVEVDG